MRRGGSLPAFALYKESPHEGQEAAAGHERRGGRRRSRPAGRQRLVARGARVLPLAVGAPTTGGSTGTAIPTSVGSPPLSRVTRLAAQMLF